MTSRISFSKLVRSELRRMNWLLAVQGLVFALLIPFRVLLVLASSRDFFTIFSQQVGFEHLENTFVILCAGLLCAVSTFGYLHSASQQDFYHSLAIRREKLFGAKLMASVLTFAIAYIGAQVLAILVGLLYGVSSAKVIVEMMAATMQGILAFLCSYAGALLAVMLTGKLLTTVLAIGVLGLYVPLLWVLYSSFYDIFFQTKYAGSVGMSESQILRFSSPWAITLSQSFASEQLVAGDTGIWPTAWYLLFLLVIAVVLFAICLCLYRIRRTEAAGQALAFRKTEGIVKLLLSIPAALLAALIAYELMHSLLWEILFIVIFGSLACIIMEFIYRWDIRQALAHKLHIALTLFAAAAIFLTFRLDLTGFDTYLPAKDEIAAMAARYSFNEHLNLDENGLADAVSFDFVSKEQLDQFETEDFEDFYRLAENGVENVKKDTYDGSFVSVAVKYRLKNGKEIYRCYSVDSDIFLEVFDSQKEQEEFAETYYPIMTWSDQTIAAMQDVVFYTHLEDEPVQHLLGLNDTAAKSDTVDTEKEQDSDEYYEISDEDIERLVEAYRKDLLECSYEDCWMDGGSYISFRLLSKYSYYVEDSYPVTEAFTNTIAVLRDILKDVEPSVSYG